MSYTSVTEFTVAESDREAFERGFAASMKATLVGVPGLRRAELLRPSAHDADRGYLAVMEFEDEAAYNTYLASASFHDAHKNPRESVAGGRTSANFETVLDLAG